MKQTVNFTMFYDSFSNRRENFSYEGLRAIFDYLEQYEEGAETEIELDPIAICCEYSEYESIEDFQSEYSDEYKTIEDIQEVTTVIPIDDNSFIIQSF